MSVIIANGGVFMRKRWKRKSGWEYSYPTLNASKKYIIDNCLEPHKYYDDWNNYRDGCRDKLRDGKLIKKVNYFYLACNCEDCILRMDLNKRNKMLVQRRKRR